MDDKPHRAESEVHISINKLYHQTHPVFTSINDKTKTDISGNSIKSSDNIQQFHTPDNRNSVAESSGIPTRSQKNSAMESSKIPTHSGHFIVPHACRTKRGAGEFMFIGKIRLKRAHLSCAPRADDFDRLWTQVMRSGENACVL